MSENKSSGLTWGDVSGFTWGKTSNFTWEELQLSAEKLLEKARDDNRPLPVSVIDKLNALCAELPEDAPEFKYELTISGACALVTAVIVYMNTLPSIAEKYSPLVQNVIEAIIDFFSN
ncbi:MAG: hypothetical protein IKS03_07005 [Ruminococcus sp.]|nr:hypothetical protein [Ruminococcus sp.]